MKNEKTGRKNWGGFAVRGFTLVELLVVMAIVGMLSTLAVNGYLSYRKNTLLDLSADNLVSQIFEMRSKTLYGNGGAKCHGVYFGKEADVFVGRGFEQDFNNRKIWDKVAGKWHYQGCGDFKPELALFPLEEDSQVKILELGDENKVMFDSLVIRFFPTDGAMEISFDGGHNFERKFDSGSLLKFKLQYGTAADSQYQRWIDFDLTNMIAVTKKVN